MEDNAISTATEMQEDDNGGMVYIWDNGDSRQGWRWRLTANNRCSGYAVQRGQRGRRYRRTDMAVEENQDGIQKRCGVGNQNKVTENSNLKNNYKLSYADILTSPNKK